MKKIVRIAILVSLLLVSCSENEGKSGSPDLPVRFSSGLPEQAESRAVNNRWEAGDRVGIYMVPHTAEASAAADFSRYTGATNTPYVTSGGGTSVALSVMSGHNAIVYPTDGGKVNFVAYYPYKSDVHTTGGNVYKVDVSNQSPSKAIDLLYHKGTGTAYDRDSEDVALTFTHQLSKMRISLTPASGVEADLSGATVTLSGFPVTADFNLSTGALSHPGGETKTITSVKDVAASSAGQAVFEAIVVPHSGASYTRSVTFTIGGTAYRHTLAASDGFEAGVAHRYTFTFTGSKIVTTQKDIGDWEGGVITWGNYQLTAGKTSFDLDAGQTSGHTLTLSTNAPSAPVWTLSHEADSDTGVPEWITGVSLSGTTRDENGWIDHTLTFGTDYNMGSNAVARTGYIRLEMDGLTLAVRVTQAAGTGLYVSDPNPASFPDLADSGATGKTFILETNSTATAPTSLTTTNPSMITNLKATRSVKDAAKRIYFWTVTFDVTTNSTSARSATVSITVGGITKTVSVSQLASSHPTHTSDGLANCYMVAPGGSVSIPITRAITVGGMSASASATVSTLWDDANVISGSPTLSGSGASRTITVRATAAQGNAVIALQNAAGTIFWSWHIWVVNYNPNVGGTWTYNNRTFMDRNLGATDNQVTLASHGLYYQWGRKDPFPGGRPGTAGYTALSRFKGMEDAGSTRYEYTEGNNTEAEILESIREPTTFFNNHTDTYSDWLRWRDDTLWEGKNGTKTCYDPCPMGWRIMDYTKATENDYFGSGWVRHYGSDGSYGLRFDNTVGYFLMQGTRSDKKPYETYATFRYLATQTPFGPHSFAIYMTITFETNLVWTRTMGRFLGLPVRCIRE
jgi:hypothetical protein